MHSYADLVHRGTFFTLSALKEVNSEVLKILEDRAPTSAVKSLQMIQLQKAILAVGMFSLFDSILQDRLSCKHGFRKAKEVLSQCGEDGLCDRFEIFISAINVLKHGNGRSYDFLVSNHKELPFRLKLPNESFFDEGDVSEISTLIEVDDQFVINCADVIEEVSNEINNKLPDCCL
ncbi:hypothetical protein AB1A65_07370 [Muricauda sp. ANG21]|uniref:hypothetical protein n=1 Tax=Allomuricauda sp. ANG21 TaxID=3042468 RepID=UPI003451174B